MHHVLPIMSSMCSRKALNRNFLLAEASGSTGTSSDHQSTAHPRECASELLPVDVPREAIALHVATQ